MAGLYGRGPSFVALSAGCTLRHPTIRQHRNPKLYELRSHSRTSSQALDCITSHVHPRVHVYGYHIGSDRACSNLMSRGHLTVNVAVRHVVSYVVPLPGCQPSPLVWQHMFRSTGCWELPCSILPCPSLPCPALPPSSSHFCSLQQVHALQAEIHRQSAALPYLTNHTLLQHHITMHEAAIQQQPVCLRNA